MLPQRQQPPQSLHATSPSRLHKNDPLILAKCSKLVFGKLKLFRQSRLLWITGIALLYSLTSIWIYTLRLNTTTTHGSKPFFHNLFWSSHQDESAACLLVMDDNHFLIEWLAYHYHTMNLRSVILVSDPSSQTSPKPVLDRWKHLMDIQQWYDTDYMTSAEEFQQAQQDVLDYFGAGGDISPQLVRHRARQRLFYYKCLRQYKIQDQYSWVLLVDTDEFVRLNYDVIDQVNLTAPPVHQPGSTMDFLKQHTDFLHDTQENGAQSSPAAALDEKNQPLYILQSSPCIQIPRIRFGAQEPNEVPTLPPLLSQQQEQQESDGATQHANWNASNFLTLHWKTHAAQHDYKKNKISKTLIDLKRVSLEDILPVDSIHMPIRSLCQQRRLHLRKSQSLLTINHYLGNVEQFTYRQRDARSSSSTALGTVINKGTNERSINHWKLAQELKNPETDDEIEPWLSGFVEDQLEPQKLLEGVGQLDDYFTRGWYTFDGNPNKDRCAFVFFGLPRAYRNMVLPSIVKNLLIPNARHNCDIYVHFYEQYEEVAGRKNRGGTVDPREIFLLQHAALAVQHKYNNNGNNNDRNFIERYAHREPTVAFTYDTEQEFWDKRGEALNRYHSSIGPDGHPLYFPWRAKTYTNSSLDNMVKQWHSIEYAFKLMQVNAKQLKVNYTRVAMFRNDAMYLTPIDIALLDKGVVDAKNEHFVVAPFARMPVNDRMIYGPYEAVKIWATERFQRIEDRVRERRDPGYEMHSEHFLGNSIFPAMEDLGFEMNINRDICFVRTRADESAMVTDCTVGGTTRGWEDLNKKSVVEDIVKRNCTKYNMGFKWTFVGCGEGIHYEGGK